MMEPDLSLETAESILGKLSMEGKPINTDADESSKSLLIVDSRDDLFSEQDDRQCSDKKVVAETNSVTSDDDVGDDQIDIVAELRQSVLTLRRINYHLQNENDRVIEENISLANTLQRMNEDRVDLREDNQALREKMELLKTEHAGTTCPSNEITSSALSDVSTSNTSLLEDHVYEFDESSHANDLSSPPFTIESDFHYMLDAQQESAQKESVGSEFLDNGETNFDNAIKTSQKNRRNMSDSTQSMKSRERLYDIDELKITTSNDEDEEDVTIQMKLEMKRDQCMELQKDLENTTEAFWEKSEELKECRYLIDKLHAENDELKCFQWVEKELDSMWARVKDMDNARLMCDSLLSEKDILQASVIEQSNQIADLEAKLQHSPNPEVVQSKVDEIQTDLTALLVELKASLAEKSNEINVLKAKLESAPCPEWIQIRLNDIQKDMEVLLLEREELQALVADKTNEITELKAQLHNAPIPEWVKERLDDIQDDLKQLKKENRKHSFWK